VDEKASLKIRKNYNIIAFMQGCKLNRRVFNRVSDINVTFASSFFIRKVSLKGTNMFAMGA